MNHFKISILFFAAIMSLSIACYFVFFLPNQARERENQRLIIQCRELGGKIEAQVNPPRSTADALPVEYHYNKKLKKCFYCGGHVNEKFLMQIIKDTYTNKDIYLYVLTYTDGNMKYGKATSGNFDEFKRIKKELFEETESVELSGIHE